MLDRLANIPDYHFGRLSLTASERMLCLAPHPDDEVLGCGGLLVLAQRQGLQVHSIIVTAGQQGVAQDGEAVNPRLAESQAAARILGLPEPECWHLSDRQLRHAAPLIERIVAKLQAFQPRWLLLPALTEPHPDHQALALAGMAAARRAGAPVDLLFYEVGAPTQPNTVVDISSVADIKWRALDAFASQEELHPYRSHAQSLAALRAFGAGSEVQAAEAFWHLPAQALDAPDALATMAFWPLQRQAVGLASDAEQLPLVSVIIRSMNRPSLAHAIASVAEQTYPHIEVVVVNASGAPHPVPAYPPQRLALRVVNPVAAEAPAREPCASELPRLGRSAAANCGLEACEGRYALFLDDDDLLGPTHVQTLVDALQPQGQAVAAYTGVRVEGPGGQWIRDYDSAWEPRRLQGINHLPIHAVLFRIQTVRAGGARFDPALPVLEDWDFWCQLSRLGTFVHVPGIGATYRQGLGDSHLGDPEHDNHWAKWHQRILEQHAQRWGVGEQSAALAWHALALDRAELAQLAIASDLRQTQGQLADCRQALARNEDLLQQSQDMLHACRTELQQTQQKSQDMLHVCRTELQQAQAQVLQLRAEHDLAQRSLQLLQQSRPVRWARALRDLAGRGN